MSQIQIKGILSFPHVFQPRAIPGSQDSTPKYSCSVLIAKNDPQLAQVQAVIEQEKANGFPSGFPANGKLCLKDCAVEEVYKTDPRFHQYMVLSMNNADKPLTVDQNLQPLMDPSQVYAGCIAWVSVGIQAYNKQVNKGVGAYINGLMPTGEEGPLGRIDGRPTAEQMFGGVAGGVAGGQVATNNTAPAMAPPVGTVPMQAAPVGIPGQVSAPPVAPPTTPNQTAPVLQMTAAANGVTYEAYKQQGWTDDQLIQNGLAIRPSFA
jgi:hypothetical protein